MECTFAPLRKDPCVLHIADFIATHLISPAVPLDEVEIEAKLGHIVDKTTNERLRLPILNDAVLVEDSRYFAFESNMTDHQHHQFNQYLNARVDACGRPGYSGTRMHYKHTRERDEFYAGPTRVTRDVATGQVLGCIRKQRLADLQVYMPTCPFDLRISINREQRAEMPRGPEVKSARAKDRLSYRHQLWKYDLTQVTLDHGEKRHELEVEVHDVKALAAECRKGDTRGFLRMIEIYVSNLRSLVRCEKLQMESKDGDGKEEPRKVKRSREVDQEEKQEEQVDSAVASKRLKEEGVSENAEQTDNAHETE